MSIRRSPTMNMAFKKEVIKKAFRYGEAWGKLYNKHLGRWKKLFFYDMVTLIYPLYIIFP